VLLNGGEDGQEVEEAELNELRIGHLQALTDVGQSRAILYQNIVRCIDLWKEALLIPSTSCDNDLEESVDGIHRVLADEHKEKQLRNDCVDLAMRLGIPKSSALLALDVFPSYQAKHAAAGTADPSDLAGMAYRLLLTNNEALNLLRAKLKHIIVDEYQDISVSQHALLRLVVRGKTDDDDCSSKPNASRSQQKKSPILMDAQTTLKKRRRASASLSQNYNVPNLFVAGDTEQSIYGWRAAAPILTVDGFRRDYPQGVVASLGE
jgi:superfamily I DNA/RNA helicase